MQNREIMRNKPWAFRLLIWVLALVLFLSSAHSLQFMSMTRFFKKSNKKFDSTVVFSVGGRVYPDGHFYAIIHIGQPPKPYHLDIDTGSDLTWVQCDAPCVNCVKGPHPPYKPSKNVVLCHDPYCSFVDNPPNYPCQNPADQCDYEIEYADHGSSLGVVLHDYFHLQLANRSELRQSLSFGCGYDQQMSGSSHPFVDGVLGLANDKSSILSQLRDAGVAQNVFGHCFSGNGGGYLFFGDTQIPSSDVVWVPVMQNSLEKYYTIGPAELLFDEKNVMDGGLSFVFDSGSTYTYFNKEAYNSVISMIEKMIDTKELTDAPEDETLPICWKGTEPFTSINDVKNFFKPLAVRFKNTKNAIMELLPQHYLIINEKGNVCFAILDGHDADLGDLNVLGDVSLQDRLVIYDNEKRQIGWVSENCDKPQMFDGLSVADDLGISKDLSDEL